MSELELEVIDSRPNPWVTALAASPFALIALLAANAIVAGAPLALIVAPHLLFFGIVASYWARVRRPFPRKVKAKARVTEQGVTIDDGITQDRIDVGSITRGVKVPSSGTEPLGPTVQLTRKGARRRELQLQSDEDADALLARLGLDVRAASASFRVMPRTYTKVWRLYMTFLAVLAPTVLLAQSSLVPGPLAALVVATGMLVGTVLMVTPSRVEVGGDGVVIRWLGRARFIRHRDIRSVKVIRVGIGSSSWETIELRLADYEQVRIPAARFDPDAARILGQRILDARDAAASGEVASASLLLRAGRAHRAWVQALRKREVIDLRSPAVPKAHLWPVIEDAATDPLERAAAVVALGDELGDAERQRLARVAKVVAAPKLRVMIEAAADADEDQLVRMLEEIEAASPRSQTAD